MKTKTKTLPTGIKTIQKKHNGKITINIVESDKKPMLTINQKIIIIIMTTFTLSCIIIASFHIYLKMDWTELLVISPIILFNLAVFTAIIINFYSLIFKS